MDVKELQNHIRTLAALEESEAPLISCYLNPGNGASVKTRFDQRTQVLRRALTGHALADFEEAATRVGKFLASELKPGTTGVAIFARGGDRRFFLALQFRVPVPNWIVIGPTPNIYHLVEIKDNYDRYVILLATEHSARIIGVNLGSVTEQIWNSRPDLRRRVGREWSKDQFQDHRRERNQQFIHEQIGVLERLLGLGGYGHVVLAGSPRATSAVRKALPKELAKRLIDVIPASASDRLSDIVVSTLHTFLEHEELESQAIAERLTQQIHSHGLAVAGTGATLQAVRSGLADYLVVVKAYDPGLGWECRRCGHMESETARPQLCPQCWQKSLRKYDIKAEMIRLAAASNCEVEVVEHSDVLKSLGGVGCLLKYLAPGAHVQTAA